MDYFEKDLEVPFLRVLAAHPNGLLMADIKRILLSQLDPSGSSAEPSPTRPGEIKLHQRIGNFTPERKRRIFTQGYATYDATTMRYAITDAGRAFLAEGGEAYDSIMTQGFTPEQRERELERDYEGLIIEEGSVRIMSVKQRKRSRLLRDLKIRELKKNGRVACCACGFDFERTYGERGKDFIHIHHTEPVHAMKEGASESVENALKKVVPLCSNCHSMVHRDPQHILPVAELQALIAASSARQ